MNDILITLILPFRERIELLNNMLASLHKTTRFPDQLEIIMAVDDDDKVLREYTQERIIQENKPFSIRFYQTKKAEHFINDYWNPIAKMAKGRWVMAINDDSVFKTKKWDKEISDKMSNRARDLRDDIVYGKTDDCCTLGNRNSKDSYFSCWALQSKEAVNALGFFYDPNIWVWGPDQVMGLIYLALNKLTKEDRIVDIYDVVIDHDSFHTEKREQDKFFFEQKAIDDKHFYETTREQEMEYALILKKYIDEKRKK